MAATTKTIGVGLFGLGTVGGAVERAFAERGKRLDAMTGAHLELVAVCEKDEAKWPSATAPVTSNPFEILDDPRVQIVVEAIGGTRAARDIQYAAFERSKHVVTANKELVAKEWNQLHEAARQAKRELRFEAAVMSAAPVVAAAQMLGASRVRVLRGLLNGTTNYICGRMEAGESFESALKEAQAKGYAEADPTNDIDGLDAAYKLSILISILDGRHFPPEQVRRTSLRAVEQAAFEEATPRHRRIRYLAVADFGEKATKARVGPEEVPEDSLEAKATGPMNVLTIDTDMAGELTFRGAGAGGDAAASALIGDVMAIARRLA